MEKQNAMWLADPKTGAVTLHHADDVADSMKAGFTQPTGMKANGEPFNGEDDLVQQTAAAENAKLKAKLDSEKAEKKTAEHERVLAQSAKAAADVPVEPDMRVAIVPLPKAAKTAPKKSVSKTKGAPPAPRRR